MDLTLYREFTRGHHCRPSPLSEWPVYRRLPSLRKKIGRRDFCELPSLIVFPLISLEGWGKPMIGCNVNSMTQEISGFVIGE